MHIDEQKLNALLGKVVSDFGAVTAGGTPSMPSACYEETRFT